MRQGKFTFLLMALMVASGLVFAGGEARAGTFSYSLCVDGITNASNQSAKYTYSFIQNPGSPTLSYIDIEIPVDIIIPPGAFSGAGTANMVVIIGLTGLTGEVYDIGIGDYGTKFGVGDLRYRVVKINIPNPAANFSIELR